jgi:hypothetical protein
MPRQFGTNGAPAAATAPPVDVAGGLYYNTASKVLYLSDGTAWNATGGAGTGPAYAEIAATAPPAASPPAIVPPTGLLWVDTSTTFGVAATAYFPPQTPPASGFNSFTDGAGMVWVSRNGSAWRLARDVLHARYYLTANLAFPGAAAISCTGVTTDPMACAGSGGFVVPLAGTYLVTANTGLSAAPATAGSMQQNIFRNGANVVNGGGFTYLANNSMWPSVTVTDMLTCAVNDLIQNGMWTTQAVNIMGTSDRTFLAVTYLGPTS